MARKRKPKNSSVLFISDTHFPYGHIDTIPFLKALKKKYKPDRVIHVGDELDYSSLSFHDADQELFSAGQELQEGIKHMKELYKLFPVVDVMHSNHGSMVFRKAKHHGIPIHCLKSYEDVLESPIGWRWHKDIVITLPNKSEVYVCHGRGANIAKVSQECSMSVVSGHYHNSLKIDYWANPKGLYFGMNVSCLIDDSSLAFAYNKNIIKRPLIGTGGIIDSVPRLFPMFLDRNGRWTGEVP